MLSDGSCVSLGSCGDSCLHVILQCEVAQCSVTALVFLWALVGTLVRVAPVPLSIFLVSPLLLRAPPVFVTLVLLWALRLVPVSSLLLALFISSLLLSPSSTAATPAALAAPSRLVLLVPTSITIIL